MGSLSASVPQWLFFWGSPKDDKLLAHLLLKEQKPHDKKNIL